MQRPDQFCERFRMQQSLNRRIGVNTEGLSSEVNFKRQETGYAEKDHEDSKHI